MRLPDRPTGPASASDVRSVRFRSRDQLFLYRPFLVFSVSAGSPGVNPPEPVGARCARCATTIPFRLQEAPMSENINTAPEQDETETPEVSAHQESKSERIDQVVGQAFAEGHVI
ncbi:hypothetical protein GCM10009760_37750 [Kitasatospora kazusensis]|uniref:Uncharacterized protein n=1 Tax=Kitasatospora kazusensis TaxID=407974 RepID=A0ABN2ZTG1_9ACTN